MGWCVLNLVIKPLPPVTQYRFIGIFNTQESDTNTPSDGTSNSFVRHYTDLNFARIDNLRRFT